MIIVIICTLLRSYPPDSSPLHNSPVILPAWLLSLSLSFSPLFPSFLSSSSLFLSRSIPAVMPSCVMLSLRSSSPVLPFSSCESLSFSRRLSHHPATPFSHTPVLPFSLCRFLSALSVPLADELRGNEREQGRPKQPPVNRNRFPLSPLSLLSTYIHRPRRSFYNPSWSSPFLRLPGKLYNAKCYPCVVLFGSLFLYLSLYLSLFISPVLFL